MDCILNHIKPFSLSPTQTCQYRVSLEPVWKPYMDSAQHTWLFIVLLYQVLLLKSLDLGLATRTNAAGTDKEAHTVHTRPRFCRNVGVTAERAAACNGVKAS
jgi:hypothetical protein